MKYIVKKVVEVSSVAELMKIEAGSHVKEIEITPYDPSIREVKGLAPRQKELFEFIVNFQKRYKKSPIFSEMMKHLKVKNLRSVAQLLEGLERKGYITRTKHKHRNIKINKAK